MYFKLRGASGDVELELLGRNHGLTARELRDLVDPGAAERCASIAIDGELLDLDTDWTTSALVRGSIVEVVEEGESPVSSPGASPPLGLTFSLTGGPAAGPSWQLSPGSVDVGRDRARHITVEDPTVSPLHLRLTTEAMATLVQDLGSHNGTRVDGEPVREAVPLAAGAHLAFGSAEARLGWHDGADQHRAGHAMSADRSGPLWFNRPPRSVPVSPPGPVEVPDAPNRRNGAAAFNVMALIAPVLIGLVMVKVMGSIRYALFALASPLMLISNHVAARRRNSKERKRSRRRFSRELQEFRAALADAVSSTRTYLEVTCPDPSELGRRVLLPSTRLWERRWHHPDYLRLRLGRGPFRWSCPTDETRVRAAPELIDAVEEVATIDRCPIELDLSSGGVVGLVGDRNAALALARSLLLQVCTLHGPADVGLVVLAARDHGDDWDWSKWLPHLRAPMGGERRASLATDVSNALMGGLLDAKATARARVSPVLNHPSGTDHAEADAGPATFVVVDDESLTVGRGAPTRSVLAGDAGPVAGMVLAQSVDQLPSVCTAIVRLRDDLGDAMVSWPQQGEHIEPVVIAGVTDDYARTIARRMSRFDDPELSGDDAGLPTLVRLLPLLGLDGLDAAGLAQRWGSVRAGPPAVPIGIGNAGQSGDRVVELDLVADGPHALIAGTTGSGKSEFLRSLVAGLASRACPDDLVFVLVDYKGGSAFDCCADLPHTVGLVTDLDDHLAERALRSLDAELRYREQALRDAGASDLRHYLASGSPAGPLPRLVVVVDEFATLAAELPDFMGALVGIAQRGRSLGVHMVLATQRPAGAVSANIKANTNIRVALRVQDAGDSLDVIDRTDASAISRRTPGRAFVRLGPSDVVAVQMPLSTAGDAGTGDARPRLRRFGLTTERGEPGHAPHLVEADSDLDQVVSLCRRAFELTGGSAPRRPWLDMLDDHIALRWVLSHADSTCGIPLAVADDPDDQAQRIVGWEPAEGHLGLFGAVGSGTTSALTATVLGSVQLAEPTGLHVYAIDFGGGSLEALGQLPHVGAVVGAGESERQARLVRHLVVELERRRDLSGERLLEPQILLVVDGFASLLAAWDGLDGQETLDGLTRLVAEGAAAGIAIAITADRPMSVPMRLLSSVTARFLFRHTDAGDFSCIGVRARDLPAFVPGRSLHAATSLVTQFGYVSDVGEAVVTITDQLQSVEVPSAQRPASIESLPTQIPLAAVASYAAAGDPLQLPLGIAEDDRRVELLSLCRGEHVLVTGPAGSGVSTSLRLFARMVRKSRADVVVVAVVDGRSPLLADSELFDAVGTVQQLEKVFELAAIDTDRTWLVIVDDAHRIDEALAMGSLLGAPHCQFIVGGRSEQFHRLFHHWTLPVRRGGSGLLLRPRLDIDGDLLGVRLPRRVPVPLVPGRGFLVVGGESTLVQVAGADLTR